MDEDDFFDGLEYEDLQQLDTVAASSTQNAAAPQRQREGQIGYLPDNSEAYDFEGSDVINLDEAPLPAHFHRAGTQRFQPAGDLVNEGVLVADRLPETCTKPQIQRSHDAARDSLASATTKPTLSQSIADRHYATTPNGLTDGAHFLQRIEEVRMLLVMHVPNSMY